MKQKNKMIVAIAVMVLTLPAFMTIVSESNGNDGILGAGTSPGYKEIDSITAVPDDFTGIYTPNDLNKIGNHIDYPLDGKYILMNDIDFSGIDPADIVKRYAGTNWSLSYRHYGGAFEVRVTGASENIFYKIDDGPLMPIAMSASQWVPIPGYDVTNDHTITLLGDVNIASFKPIALQYKIDKGTIPTTSSGITVTAPSGAGNFIPIGTYNEPFTGVFDGNGYSINGLDIWGVREVTGIFGKISNATVMNLKTDAKITTVPSINTPLSMSPGVLGANYTGSAAIVGLSVDSFITNCLSTGDIMFGERYYIGYVGGVVGASFSTVFTNLEFTGKIEGEFAIGSSLAGLKVGGIVGVIDSKDNEKPTIIDACINSGDITIKNTTSKRSISCGGIMGTMESSPAYIIDSVNSGNLTVTTMGGATIGGIGGYVYLTYSGSAVRSGNTGEINLTLLAGNDSTSEVGGLFGSLQGHVLDCYNEGNINITSAGTPTVYIGGLAGMTYKIYSFKCYNEGDITFSGSNSTARIGGLAGYLSGSPFIGIDYNITDCYNLGNISAENTSSSSVMYIGGIAGLPTSSAAKINNCYNDGDIVRSGTDPLREGVGGIAGALTYSTATEVTTEITNCFTKEIDAKVFRNPSGATYVEDTYSIEKTASELLDKTTYTDAGWDFKNIWKIDEGMTPTFRALPAIDASFEPENGDEMITYQIEYGEVPPVPTVEREGYTFAGWFTEIDDVLVEYTGWALTEDTTFFAQWSKIEPVVTFDPDNGGEAWNENVDYGDAVAEPTVTKHGYTFIGWYNGETPWNFDDPVFGNMTLTAHWTENEPEGPEGPGGPEDPEGPENTGGRKKIDMAALALIMSFTAAWFFILFAYLRDDDEEE